METFVNNLQTWVAENQRQIAISIGMVVVTFKVGSKMLDHLDEYKKQRMLKHWENAPKDVVIFHTLPRGKTVPNLSPFGMKLETYLRMNEIPYEVDFENPWGPVGKTPWITLNGKHVADSQVILERLSEKYNVKAGGSYSDEERALAIPIRIMMDEYLYWGLVLWRYVHSGGKGLEEIVNYSKWMLSAFYRIAYPRIKANAWAQGIGRHSPEQVTNMMKDGLKSLSLILGTKKFILGNEPCEDDCAVFGGLAEFLWAAPGSPYENYIKDELKNLHDYCIRMKDLYWNDWDQCIDDDPANCKL